MAAVNKAVDLLENLRTQVMAEGEAEAATYNKFACFCQDTTEEKLQTIQKSEDEKVDLVSSIGTLVSRRDGLDTKIQMTLVDISNLEKEMKDLTEQRQKTLRLYEKNIADLTGALEALRGAIDTLKTSKTPSLVQLQSVSQTVRAAALLADALGLGGGSASVLLQQPANEVQMEDYKFHSDSIIKTLEGLLVDFKAEKQAIDEGDVSSVKTYNELTQEKTHAKKMKNKELGDARKDKAQTITEVSMASQQLTTVEASLLEDKEYTNKLSQMCSDKAKTWDQRTRARADELATLTQAIGIIGGAVQGNTSASTIRFAQQSVSVRLAKAVAVDTDAMSAIENAAEEADMAPSLVQASANKRGMLRASVKRHPEVGSRDVIVRLLKQKGQQFKSTLLTALASKIAADPFAKVKQLIQELIERLLQQAANDANQKGWCDKAISDVKQKRDYAAEEIENLNVKMANLEVVRDRLGEEIVVLLAELAGLSKARTNATNDRATEKDQNQATVTQAQEGLAALDMCIDLLDKFYKTMKKNTVDLSLAQGPLDDAPDGFEIGKAYVGAQSEAGGILGMLDVMKSDFVRTVTETQIAEKQAEQDFLEFMTETGKAEAEKTEAHSQKDAQKTDVTNNYYDLETLFMTASDTLQGALHEQLDLKPVCVDTGMSYSDRVSRRQDEIESLNKAMCVLERYAQYGPDGAGDAC